MKKVFLVILCLLVVFIPTYIAIGSYSSSNKEPVTVDNVDKLEIIDLNGVKTELAKGSDDGFIEFMVSASSAAEKILVLPEPLLDNPYFTLTYHSFGKENTYNYYFSKQSTDAYFVDSNGMAFHMLREDAEKFLETKYAHCIYDNSSAPTLFLDGGIMNTTSAKWQFKGLNDKFYESITQNGENAPVQTYGTPILNFTIEPDSLKITLKNGNEVLYDGFYSDLAYQDLSGNSAKAHIVATWYESSDRNYRGELTYDLDIIFKKPPVFYISSNKATIGDVLTISVQHADDANFIHFTSEPSIDYAPKFYKDGEYMRALIPVSTSCIPGSYSFSVDYNNHSQTNFTVDVTSRYTASYPYNLEDAVYDSLYSESNIREYEALFETFFDNVSETRAFSGNFISGLPNGTFESADYGDLLTINKNNVQFENPGLYYSCNKISEVKAVNAGKVIFAGSNTLAGNMVAIDHGFGLVSVYKHLSETSISVGETVETGTVLGKSGRTGLMSKKGANITVARVELYVNGIPVDITPLIEKGIIIKE